MTETTADRKAAAEAKRQADRGKTTEDERPELKSKMIEHAEPVTNLAGEPLTEEEIDERYQDPPVPKDPNTPISKDDPNDRLRAEGPEVADPAKVAAGLLFEEAKANMPDEPVATDDRTEAERTADDLKRADLVAATGPGSGEANTSGKPAAAVDPVQAERDRVEAAKK